MTEPCRILLFGIDVETAVGQRRGELDRGVRVDVRVKPRPSGVGGTDWAVAHARRHALTG